ncbi:methyltransferase domain-containing protein [Saccharicrinis sp. FJH2]|uniref:methyltransferase domain-containing protein n=1 Tax=Saccharicrinis sp. FJH65 TaxID=3344659 RepID=UPI0035F393B9
MYYEEYSRGFSFNISKYFAEGENIIRNGEYYAGILNKYTNPGKMLDIGAAGGFFMQGFSNNRWDVIGIESDKNMTDFGIRELNLRIINSCFEIFDVKGKYDLISFIQPVSQFFNLKSAISKMYNIINPNGYVLIENWNLDRFINGHLNDIEIDSHNDNFLGWLSQSTLTESFSNSGFSLIETGYTNSNIMIDVAINLLERHHSDNDYMLRLKEMISQTLSKPFQTYEINISWNLFQKMSNDFTTP